MGKAKNDHELQSYLCDKYGDKFVIHNFTALGVDFDNSSSLQTISDSNYEKKIKAAKSRVDFWKTRDLTVYGRVTLIKSIIFAQFVYIIMPLLRPNVKILNNITTFVFNFVWGGKRDKLKRDIITQKRESGGLGMIYPRDFIMGLKLKLIHRIGDINFSHKWKDVVLNQVRYPDHPGICFENGLISPIFSFSFDLINCYLHWKDTASKNLNCCINHCIWGNKSIKDIGSKLWNPRLIEYNINYLTDFINNEGEVLSYDDFCVSTLSRRRDLITNREYVDIKMSIRRFSNPNSPQHTLKNINLDLALSFL